MNRFPALPLGFKIRDCSYSTYGNQALQSFDERHKKQFHKSRHAVAAQRLLANIGVPTYQPTIAKKPTVNNKYKSGEHPRKGNTGFWSQ